MRYCPHCERFNRGKPKICHFCGRTWFVRLCPRGHENPPNAQFCGSCGSADLSEPATTRLLPWLLLKMFFWFVFGLLIAAVYWALWGVIGGIILYLLPLTVIVLLLLLAYSLALAALPKPLGGAIQKGTKKILSRGAKLLGEGMRRIWR